MSCYFPVKKKHQNLFDLLDVDPMDTTQSIYYGVYIPNDIQAQDNDGSRHVFFDKIEALKEVKKYKKARFKAFQFYHEALEFAIHGSEFPNNNSTLEINSSKSNETSHSVGEKPSQFRGPKSQDLVKLRKSIEIGDVNFVKTTVWENPRYLISSGDTPSILQEGSRYNALHVAAKAKNAEMCDLILSTVGSPEFLQLLYGEENRANSEDGSKILLDLYLNTPDKGLNETPLHFAVKFGAAEVVEALVSYPQCDKNVLNKYSDRPRDMICNRVSNPSRALVEKIAGLLEDRFYVPVLRSEDNCIQPVIGEPFSPVSPPNLNRNLTEPRVEIHAFAGPMKKEEATIFRKKWKTPPRITITNTSNLSIQSSPKLKTPVKNNSSCEKDFRLQDTEKGLERVGRNLARRFNVGWKEYWPFLGTFTDLTSAEGLESLENYLKNRFVNAFSESISNSVNKMVNSETDIIKSSSNGSSVVSPMSELCKNFEACTLSDNSSPKIEQRPMKGTNQAKTESVFDFFSQAGTSPCLCIEKSCQVFANRIAHQILYQMDSVTVHTIESLETEIKHLKSLIGSFMDDPAFINVVNFQSVHSRIAFLISCKLKQALMYDEELDEKIRNLETIIQKYDKMVDLFSSDDEELNNYNQPIKFIRRKSTSDSKQIICLVEHLLKSLECLPENEFVNANVEEDCLKAWANAPTCACVWKTNKSSRKGSFMKKNNGSKFSKSATNIKANQYRSVEPVSRKLFFFDGESELDKGDNLEIVEPSNKYPGKNMAFNNDNSSSSSEYHSANTSKVSSDNEYDSEIFEDVENDELDVYIEGNIPTKIDFAVYTATKEVEINPKDYPNIYRWRHSINIVPEEERMSWASPSTPRYRFNISKYASAMSTPRPENKRTIFSPPTQSWLRVTGQNSPMRSLNALKDNIYLPCEEN